EDAALERALRPRIDILRRECGLGLLDLADRLGEVALLGPAAVQDAGLVEMQMRLDEAGRHQPAADIELLRLRAELRRQRDDLAARDADVDQPIGVGRDARMAQDEVHGATIAPIRPLDAARRGGLGSPLTRSNSRTPDVDRTSPRSRCRAHARIYGPKT